MGTAPMPEPAPTYTPKKAARLLGKHVSTIQRWCRAGLMGRRVARGKGWVIPRAQVEQLLAIGGEPEQERKAS